SSDLLHAAHCPSEQHDREGEVHDDAGKQELVAVVVHPAHKLLPRKICQLPAMQRGAPGVAPTPILDSDEGGQHQCHGQHECTDHDQVSCHRVVSLRMASTMACVSTLTRVTRWSRSMTYSLWSARKGVRVNY